MNFILQKDVIQNLEINGKKDRIGLGCLVKSSGDLKTILLNHHDMMDSFCVSLCESLFDDKKSEIYQCNAYYKKIFRQMKILYRVIAKSVGNDIPISEIEENETYYLDRAMGQLP